MEFLRNLFKAKSSNDPHILEVDIFNDVINYDDYLTSQSSETIDEIINTYNSLENEEQTKPEFIDYSCVKYENDEESKDILDLDVCEAKPDLDVNSGQVLVEIDMDSGKSHAIDSNELTVNAFDTNAEILDNIDEVSTEIAKDDEVIICNKDDELIINANNNEDTALNKTMNNDINEFNQILDNLQKLNSLAVTKISDSKNDPEDLDEILLNLQKDKELKVKFKAEDTISIISISSDETHEEIENDDDDGYNSSDFEFITEEEAKRCGLYTPFKVPIQIDSRDTMYTVSIEKEADAGFQEDYSYRDNHIIPEGDDYLNLFQGIYAPQFHSAMYFMDNKSTQVSKSMHVDFGGVGFDMRVMDQRNVSDDMTEQYKKEAEENAQKILSIYPAENRKRRRRF